MKVRQENLSAEALKRVVPKKRDAGAKGKKKTDKSLRAVFRQRLSELDIEKLKKPWMATKSFLLLDTAEKLIRYVDSILKDQSLWQQPYLTKPERMPVVAVDTETYGLDTRIIVDFEYVYDPNTGGTNAIPVYELNIEIAGVCLSADGIKGVYIPIFHEDGNNVPLEVVTAQLQRLFDQSHLVFYNAKFDREVMRQTLGIEFRPYPYFEDVQVLHYINDPKAKIDDDTFKGGAEGLKSLSDDLLGMTMIELGTIGKVSAELEKTPEEAEALRIRANWTKQKKKDLTVCAECQHKATWLREQIVRHPDGEETTDIRGQCDEHTDRVVYKKESVRKQMVPFMWIPTEMAVWYAASDAICTWLLWQLLHDVVQGRRRPHQIDGELIDTITWMERQRWLIDTERHTRLVKWSAKATEERLLHLQELAIKHGWEVATDDDNNVIPGTEFNVNSGVHLPKLLFDIKGYVPIKVSGKTGHRSVDKEVLLDLFKLHPNDEFLLALKEYKEYVALHPEKLAWDQRDKTARIYLKQAVVAGGRLAAAGGEFLRDGGLQLNPQAIKSVGGNWWVNGDLLTPDSVAEADVEEHPVTDLDPSCFRGLKDEDVKADDGQVIKPDDPKYAEAATHLGFVQIKGKWMRKAPGILRNHIGNYLGYAMCLVPGCETCREKHGILIKKTRLDANQILNFRALFIPEPGFTTLVTDYSNIEVRGAANVSGETELQKIFLEGDGDHHALTASKVFPEFNDPATSKARRKTLRSAAKIINFALQYGGTHFTIFENLKEFIPDITMKRTKEMVDAYWKGVPMFAAWCDNQRREAREKMVCHCVLGRIIKFDSAMKELGITIPTEEQEDLYRSYCRKRKDWRILVTKIDEDKARPVDQRLPEDVRNSIREESRVLKEHMDKLWQDEDSGVRNALDYHSFMGKIERVAMNAPIQGLAGDFMRMALNRIRKWATILDPVVQTIFRLHNTVHDEINYTIKNPYLPYVVPRVTRLMKLRTLHARLGWPVPIEADTEYGTSWDIEHHLTGDADHSPAGWTHVKGMEEYLPAGVEMSDVERITSAIASGDERKRAYIEKWFKSRLHPRAALASWYALWFYDKDKKAQPLTDADKIRRQVIVAFQLDEYWLIDGTPDGEEAQMETFEQYEARCGLTEKDRGYAPPGGWLFTPPQDRVKRKKVPELGPALPPEPVEPEPENPQGTFQFEPKDEPAGTFAVAEATSFEEMAPVVEESTQVAEPEAAMEVVEVPQAITTPAPKPAADESDMLYDPPKRPVDVKATPVTVSMPPVSTVSMPTAPAPRAVDLQIDARHLPDYPEISTDLPPEDYALLMSELGYPLGTEEVNVIFNGQVVTLHRMILTTIPDKYLKVRVHA